LKASWSCANDGAGYEMAAEAALIDRRANGGSSPDLGPAAQDESAGIESLMQ
jgi:hypothetical protein